MFALLAVCFCVTVVVFDVGVVAPDFLLPLCVVDGLVLVMSLTGVLDGIPYKKALPGHDAAANGSFFTLCGTYACVWLLRICSISSMSRSLFWCCKREVVTCCNTSVNGCCGTWYC